LILATSKKSPNVTNSKKVRYRIKGCIKHGYKLGKWTLACGRKIWCTGFIKKMHDDGTCLFLFEDGDEIQNLVIDETKNSVDLGCSGTAEQEDYLQYFL